LDTLQEGVEVEFSQITAGDVKQAVSRAKFVAGADGWNVQELKW